jgi:hypothetical protein
MSISKAKLHTQRALELIEAIEPSRSASSQTALRQIRKELEAALKEISSTQDLASGH